MWGNYVDNVDNLVYNSILAEKRGGRNVDADFVDNVDNVDKL